MDYDKIASITKEIINNFNLKVPIDLNELIEGFEDLTIKYNQEMTKIIQDDNYVLLFEGDGNSVRTVI